FCFSRSWVRYSEPCRMRSRPCSPGGYGRRSIGHFIESHLGPFRNSFIFSRRQSRQTGPVYRAISCAQLASRPQCVSHPAPLLGPAAVVGDRCEVLDAGHPAAGVHMASALPSIAAAPSSLPHLLLPGDGLLRPLAGAGVGVRALAPDRQAPAVTHALVGADLHLALDVLLDVAAQVALHLRVG